MPILTDEVVTLSTRGVAVIVATRDATIVPAVTRGWGLCLLPKSEQALVCVTLASSERTLANVADNGYIAVTFSLPSTYRTFQIKGRVLDVATPSDDDVLRVQAHLSAFLDEAASVGLPREVGWRLFTPARDAVPAMQQLRIRVEALFDQTPGPSAGARL